MTGLQGRSQKLNIAAWTLSFIVIVVGIVMYITTDRGFFLILSAIGLLTVINVVVYDNLILKPQLRAQAAKEAEAAGAPVTDVPAADVPADREIQK